MDENIINFQGSVKIPNEIRDVKNTVLFGLTGRQLGSAAISLVVVGGISGLLCGGLKIDSTVSIMAGLLVASPFFAFGFIRPGGIPLEDWCLVQYSNFVKSAPVRKLSAENAYETAMRLADLPQTEKGKKKKTKDKKKRKRTQKKTSYRFRK